MPTYEMFWDCPSCGTAKLLGKTHRHCPNCGIAQDPEARYFPPEDEKVAVEDHVYVGRDLICAHCETPNSAIAKHCTNCGAAIGDGDDVGVKLVGEAATPIPSASSGSTDADFAAAVGDRGDRWRERTGKKAAPEAPGGGSGVGKAVGCLVVLGVVAAAVLCCTLALWTEEGQAEIVGRRWERAIEIESYSARSQSDWCDRMPSDAYSVSRSERERSSRQVADGEDCRTVNKDNGDGTFTQTTQCTTRYRSEPTYDDWCTYTVDRWGTDRWERASGTQRDMPRWPTVSTTDCQRVGCTREGSRTSEYTVSLRQVGGSATRSCEVAEARWLKLTEGARYTVQIGVLDGGIRCPSL